MHVESPSVSESPRAIFHPHLGSIPSASEVRRILSSLIAHNSLARNGASVEPRGEIQNFLTNEVCNTFARQIRAVEEQRGSLPLNGTVAGMRIIPV